MPHNHNMPALNSCQSLFFCKPYTFISPHKKKKFLPCMLHWCLMIKVWQVIEAVDSERASDHPHVFTDSILETSLCALFTAHIFFIFNITCMMMMLMSPSCWETNTEQRYGYELFGIHRPTSSHCLFKISHDWSCRFEVKPFNLNMRFTFLVQAA